MKKGVGRLKHVLNKSMPVRHKHLRWTLCGYRVSADSVSEDKSKAGCQICLEKMEKK